MNYKNKTQIAESAVKLLRDGIKHNNKSKIMAAYEAVEHDDFNWDGLEVLFVEWDELVDEANEILLA